MKIKKWHLFVFIITLFVVSFYVINLRFDKFYRLNGINNDNRVLIEKYLDEDEQKYLTENQIAINDFIKFIKFEDFHLVNYKYYNLLDENTSYSNKEIISLGNNLVSRLEFLYDTDAYSYAKILVEASLENAFLHNEQFNFQYVDIYKSLKPLYSDDDYSYVDDTLVYIERLKIYGVSKINDVKEKMALLCQAYNKDSLKKLLNATLDANVSIIYDPYEFTTVVDSTHYIGEYAPKELLLTQDLPRVRYSMYLQKDAYIALMKMYQALGEELNGFLLSDAYENYNTLKEDDLNAGFNEIQLGLTIAVSKREISYNQFEETDISKWLEEHAYEYGFILRYPKHKASITNHAYDPHIYRYVGKSLAKTLHDSNMTLEEYRSQ